MKIETSSLLLGAFARAVAVLCVAAATTKTNADASGDKTAEGKVLEQLRRNGVKTEMVEDYDYGR